ncbi:hypothetical protein FACS189491_04810 [Spirochaetia bacterium]|nr:hypothetical protein FACS189491_04810 [Spirochaetia bacterium]
MAAGLLCLSALAFTQEANTAVTNLAWVDAEGNALTEAHLYDTLYAAADINGAHIPDGAEVSVIIFEYNEDEGLPDDHVTQISATVEDGAIRAAWKVIYDEEQTNTQCSRELAEKGYTIPRYRFRVRYDSASSPSAAADGVTYRSAFSAPLTVWGSVTVQLRAGDPFNRFILRLADGSTRKVVADDEGYIRAFRLPLGFAELIVDIIPGFIDAAAGFDTGAFFSLCANGTTAEVRAAIENGADVNARGGDGGTPLHRAARNIFGPAIIPVLVEAGADMNARNAAGETPLITFLHGTGTYYDGPSYAAAVTYLAEHGADVNARDNNDFTALLTAAQYCPDSAIIAALLDAGAELTLGTDERHNELRTIYGREGTGRSLRYLLDAGGAEGFFTLLDHGGATEIIDQAISLGFDLNSSDARGRTPLMYAAEKNSAKTIQTLLAAGADITLRDKDGKTALDYARKGNPAYVLLVAAAEAAGR